MLRASWACRGPITDQAELSRWLDTARQTVDSAVAREAQHRGALMTLREVVRYTESAFDQA